LAQSQQDPGAKVIKRASMPGDEYVQVSTDEALQANPLSTALFDEAPDLEHLALESSDIESGRASGIRRRWPAHQLVIFLFVCVLVALASRFGGGTVASEGWRNGAVFEELDQANDFCAFEVEGGCMEQGHPDNDCCALPGDGSCEAGYSFSQGSVCFKAFGAVATCCRKEADAPAARPAGPAPTPQPSPKPQSLDDGTFCWLVTMSSGGEADLVIAHFKEHRSIFTCSEWSVFTDTANLACVPVTNIGSVQSKLAPWGSWYNSEVFLRAWDTVVKEQKYARHAWTTKVDADTVFLPSRLLWHVHGIRASDPWYLKNGDMLLGAIEVFSNGAVRTFAERGRSTCVNGIETSGEDGFIDHCMNLLKVSVKIDGSLLKSTRDVQACSDHSSVAFHPFKDLGGFAACQSIAAR